MRNVRLSSLVYGPLSIFAILLLILLAPRLVQFVQLGVIRAVWPWQLDFVEGINLNATLQLAEGRDIYRINGPEEFISAPYTPLYHLLTLPFAWLSGPSLTGGRIITLLSTVGIGALLIYIVRRISGLWLPALVSGILWLSLGPTIVWSAFYKQDITAMLFDLAGFAVILTNSTGRRIYWAALLFALAFYTKQSAITGAAAAGLWLVVRDWRTGIKFGSALGAMVLVPFLVGNALLRGGLWEHWVGYHAPLPHADDRWWRHMGRLVGEYWPLLIICVVSLLGAVVALFSAWRSTVRAKLATVWTPILLYVFFGWLSSITKLGYEGANYNHLLDGLLPSCLLAGLALGTLEGRMQSADDSVLSPQSSVLRTASLATVAALFLTQVLIMDAPQAWYRGGWPSPERDKEMRGVAQLVASTPGDMYSEDAHLLLKYGKRVIYDDASTFVPLTRIGRWDDSMLVQSVRDRRFSLIILQGGRWSDAGWKAFNDNYYLDFPGSIEYFEPKVYPDSPQYDLQCRLSGDGPAISLLGYSLGPGVAQTGQRPGDVLRATLYWQADAKLTQNFASYLHVLNEQGERVAGRDNPQTGALQPTTSWDPGNVITDVTAIPLPTELLPGHYHLIAGMYEQAATGLADLKPECAEAYGNAVSLGWVEVK